MPGFSNDNVAAAPRVTIAVINYHLRGYPRECLESLGAADPSPDTEYLLIESADAAKEELPFPAVRRVQVEKSDRATAKNLAIAEAKGEFLQLATADILAEDGAVETLRRFVEEQPGLVIASAQLLLENGFQRRTDFGFPSIMRELNLPRRIWRRVAFRIAPSHPPMAGRPRRARTVHATFLMARREVFEKIGPFSEGYRCAVEDMEWCHRAAEKGIDRLILPEACVFKIAPQLNGFLSLEIRVAMERSLERLVEQSHSPAYSSLYKLVRRGKWLCRWFIALGLNGLFFGGSPLLQCKAKLYRTLAGFGGRPEEPPTDAESHWRWETVI